MNDYRSYLGSLSYFVAGALAGGAVALLVAPQAGRVTRAMMRRQVRDTTDTARRLRDRVVHRGEVIGDEAAQRVTEAVSALAGRGPRKANGPGSETASV
jgi:gas vesicle protein